MGRKGPQARRGAGCVGIDPRWVTAGRRALGAVESKNEINPVKGLALVSGAYYVYRNPAG